MGQKINPIGYTVGFYQDWRSRWVTDKQNFGLMIYEDYQIRKIIKTEAKGAAIAKIEIERRGDEITIFVFAARQGILIGKRGQEIDRIKDMVQGIATGPVKIVIKEISNPEAVSQNIAESITEQLEKRMAFRRILKKTIESTLGAGVKGVKIQVSGRLNGAEMARTEKIAVGRMPCQTMRADIDYGFAEAHTTYGRIGVKVWVYHGDKMGRRSIKAPSVAGS